MKKLLTLAGIAVALAAVILVVVKLLSRNEELTAPSAERSEGLDLPTFDESELGGQVSPELLSILVCPEDKGPLSLSDDGKWLVNPRNGYRYPIRKGIPVMLIEEGRKNQDTSLIQLNA